VSRRYRKNALILTPVSYRSRRVAPCHGTSNHLTAGPQLRRFYQRLQVSRPPRRDRRRYKTMSRTMRNDLSCVGASSPFPASPRDRAAPAAPTSLGGGVLACVAFHEAAHALVGRYFGFPIAVATIVPTKYHGGQVRGPGCNPDDNPQDMVREAEERCDQARAALPPPGEDRTDIGAWIAHVQCRVY
jgi:hypothetical protein